jgi:hypothetical protein
VFLDGATQLANDFFVGTTVSSGVEVSEEPVDSLIVLGDRHRANLDLLSSKGCLIGRHAIRRLDRRIKGRKVLLLQL